MADLNIITMAYGRKIYSAMAENLARSFLMHASGDIAFYLATDKPSLVSPKVASKINIIDLNKIKLPYAKGFLAKTCIDLLVGSKPGKYLFVDSDCLFYSSPKPVFSKLQGYTFTAIGRLYSTGEWFGDIVQRCKAWNVHSIPVFVGAIYYFELTNGPSPVLSRARAIAGEYDSIGLVRLRNLENEEPLISLAMAIEGMRPYTDSSLGIKIDAMFCDLGHSKTDLNSGQLSMSVRPNALITSPQLATYANPCIVHYNDSFVTHWLYVRDAAMLYFLDIGCGPFLSKLCANLCCIPQYLLWPRLREFLRPFYRVMFGTRAIKPSSRIE
jgi:hypothetical protein